LPPFTITCPNYDNIKKDEFKDGEADKSGRATPLPPDLYSPQDEFYNEDEFVDGDTDRSGRANPLPPDSYSICKMINISAHPKFKSLLKVNSICKGSRLLFEFLLGSSQVGP
jgi:hypothetical protein